MICHQMSEGRRLRLRPSFLPGLFQLGAVPEGVAHLLAQYPVGVVDGVEDDGPQLVRVVTHQAALHRHGQFADEGSVHKL